MALTAQSLKLQRQNLNKIEKGINKIAPSREVALSKTALQESIMFLGLCMGDINESVTPYPESENSKSAIIEDRADTSVDDYNFDNPKDHVAMVKELRYSLQTQVESVQACYKIAADTVVKQGHEPFFPTHLITALTAVEKSKMWLGMELNRILTEGTESKKETQTEGRNGKK